MTQAPGGARRRTDPRARPTGSALAAGVVVLLAIAAVLLTLPADAPSQDRTEPTGALVERTVLACPSGGGRGETAVDLGLAAAPGAPDAGGTVQAGPVDGRADEVQVGRGALVEVPGRPGVKVAATGPAAVGLFGFRTDRVGSRSLATAGCPEPRAQWWFTGAGAGLDHSSTLLLANVDPGPAVVDLRVLGPDGEVRTVGTTGITVPPNSRQRIDLTEVAPQTDELALGVHASRGRVVASVDDSFTGAAGTGRDWLSGTDLPTRRVRLAGLPARGRGQRLFVANPGDLEALVEVQVAGASGTFTPTGLEPVAVAPGAVEAVDLADVLPRGEAVGLRLRSRVPVVATVRTGRQGDTSYAAEVTALTGPAAAPLLRGVDASVQLTAGAQEATAELTAYDRDGERVDRTTLRMDPGATRTWEPDGGAGYLVVRPTDGRVLGAVTYSGAGVTTVPLRPLPIRVQRPTVQPALH
jgi:hypothetical protein